MGATQQAIPEGMRLGWAGSLPLRVGSLLGLIARQIFLGLVALAMEVALVALVAVEGALACSIRAIRGYCASLRSH